MNSRPLTTETISNPTSDILLSPSNILTIKSLRSLCHYQGISVGQVYIVIRDSMVSCSTNQKWVLVMLKEFLQSLQTHNKWQIGKRNFLVGDVVLLCQNEVGWNWWPMAKITEVFKEYIVDMFEMSLLYQQAIKFHYLYMK